jgi:FKBP-type peptidyl-prolyl cis-trans isomerase
MKKVRVVLVSMILTVLFSVITHHSFSQDFKKIKLANKVDSISYIIGTQIGKDFVKNELEINLMALTKGMEDAKPGNKDLISDSIKQIIMQDFQSKMQTKQQKKKQLESVQNKIDGYKFLADNKKNTGVIQLESGLQYQILQEGTGPNPKETDTVTVHYRGKLINGKVFDASYDRKEPATFPLNAVIKGWQEGLLHMKVGGKYLLFIPPDLAYGDKGAGEAIPAGSTLIFEIEFIAINPKK